MKSLQLCYPVKTLDGKELLSPGVHLTRDTMESLVSAAEKEKYPLVRLSEYKTVDRDLHNICKKPPYNRIFTNSDRKEEICDTIGQVELIKPLIDIYDFFKAEDPYTYLHILTVFALSLYLAQELIENREEFAKEVAAAPSHDIGKICIPLSLLKKTGPLDKSEREWLSHHSAAGYVLLSYYLKDPFHPAAIAARDHHERRNGSGYPRGIAYRNKMVEIIAVSDVFDALITKRPYRKRTYDIRSALEELSLQVENGLFDKDIVQALIKCNRMEEPLEGKIGFSRETRTDPTPDNHYSGAIPCQFEPDCSSKTDKENE